MEMTMDLSENRFITRNIKCRIGFIFVGMVLLLFFGFFFVLFCRKPISKGYP